MLALSLTLSFALKDWILQFSIGVAFRLRFEAM